MQKINFKNLPSTDTPINATNLNLMQDNIESAIEEINIYSENETVVGTYIDGKPIYRQVIEEMVANQGNYKVIKSNVNNLLNISIEIDDFEGTCYYLDSNPRVISLSKVENQVRIKTESNVINGLAMIATIEYTKTTD